MCVSIQLGYEIMLHKIYSALTPSIHHAHCPSLLYWLLHPKQIRCGFLEALPKRQYHENIWGLKYKKEGENVQLEERFIKNLCPLLISMSILYSCTY